MCCLKVYETHRTDTNLKMSVCYLVTWKALNDQSDPSLWTPHFHYTPIKTCKVQGADKQNRHNNSSAFLSLCILIKCLEKHLIQVYCWMSLMILSLFQKNINNILKYKNLLYNKKNPILIKLCTYFSARTVAKATSYEEKCPHIYMVQNCKYTILFIKVAMLTSI